MPARRERRPLPIRVMITPDYLAEMQAMAEASDDVLKEQREDNRKLAKFEAEGKERRHLTKISALNAKAATRVEGDETPAVARKKRREQAKTKKINERWTKLRNAETARRVAQFVKHRKSAFAENILELDEEGQSWVYERVNLESIGISVLHKDVPEEARSYLLKRAHTEKSMEADMFRFFNAQQTERHFSASKKGHYNPSPTRYENKIDLDRETKACFFPLFSVVLPYPDDPTYGVARIWYKVFSAGDGDGPPKFLTPSGRPLIPYIPRGSPMHKLLDPNERFYVIESPFKAAAAAAHGLTCIGVNGCFGNRVKDAKFEKGMTPLQARLTMRPEIHPYLIEGREVCFLTDADVRTNLNVAKAQLDFMGAAEVGFKCRALYTEFPDLGDGKTGTDDYFAAGNTVKDLAKLPTHRLNSKAVGTLQSAFMDLTEKGLGDRFVTQQGEDCKHDHKMGEWFSWTTGGWVTGITEPMRAMKLVVDALKGETAAAHGTAKKAHWDFQKQCGKHAAMVAGLKQAAIEKALEIDGAAFDTDHDLLGTQDCIVRLSTGERLEWTRDKLVSKRIACGFDPKAQAVMWFKFLHTICGVDPDPKMMMYLQEVAGACLAGRSVRQEVFFLTGEGANGKSVYIETLTRMMGEYAVNVPAALLMKKPRAADPEKATPFLVTLFGKRLATCTEWDESTAIDEAMLKNLTGGDLISGRENYGAAFNFRNRSRLLIRTNHFPVVRGTGKATWDRIKDVPFRVTIPEKDQDPDLGEKIGASELAGVFVWALEGYRRFAARHFRFDTPTVVLELTAEHRKVSDVLGTWIEESIEVETGARELQAEITKDYTDWCLRNNHEPMSSKNLWSKLRERYATPSNPKLTYSGNDGTFSMGLKLRRNKVEVSLLAQQQHEIENLKSELRLAKGLPPVTGQTTSTTPFGEKVISIKRGRKK